MPGLGDYELGDEIGRGAMGRVFVARHRPTGALRAVKILDGPVSPEAVARFRREAETLARAGPGVVPVHESGMQDGRAFIVLGLMKGGSLRERLKVAGSLPWRDAVALAASLARALESCHRAGLVHRDVKTGNVLFDDEDRPRLADFGLVRQAGADRLTATGEVLGTPAYMAPEQIDGQPAGPGADVFALGIVLHELIAGELPFVATGTLFDVYRRRTSGSRPRLADVGPVPRALDAILDRALAPRPEDRPTADALAHDLEGLLEGPVAESRRRALALLIPATLLAIAFAAFALVRRSRRHEETAVPPPGHVVPTASSPAPPSVLPSLSAVATLVSRLPAGLLSSEDVKVAAACPPELRDTIRDAAVARAESESKKPFIGPESIRTNFGAAAAAFRIARAADPSVGRPLQFTMLAEGYSQLPDDQKALEDYWFVVEDHPERAWHLAAVAGNDLEKNRISDADALDAARQARKLSDDPNVARYATRIFVRAGKLDEAVAAVDEDIGKGLQNACEAVAGLREALGKLSPGAADRLVDHHPDCPCVYVLRGRVWSRRPGGHERTAADFQKAADLGLPPSWPWTPGTREFLDNLSGSGSSKPP